MLENLRNAFLLASTPQPGISGVTAGSAGNGSGTAIGQAPSTQIVGPNQSFVPVTTMPKSTGSSGNQGAM